MVCELDQPWSGEPGVGRVCAFNERGEPERVEFDVVVHDGDPLCGGELDAAVDGGGEAEVRAEGDEAGAMAQRDSLAIVGAAIVQDEDGFRLQALAGERGKGVVEKIGLVPVRNNNCDAGGHRRKGRCQEGEERQGQYQASTSSATGKALLEEEEEVLEAVAPGIEFDLAEAGGVHDGDLLEAGGGVEEGFDLDLFGESHAVGFELHVLEDAAAEDPHAALRVADPTEEKERHGEGQNEVAELVLEAHGAAVAHGEAGGVEEIGFEVEEGFDEVADGVGGVAVIAVEGDDDIPGGHGEALLVAAAVAADVFADDDGAEVFGDLGSTVSGGVVDNDDLIDKVGHEAQDLLDALLFIETRDDNGDLQILVQGKCSSFLDPKTSIVMAARIE